MPVDGENGSFPPVQLLVVHEKRPYPTTSFAIGRNPLAGGSYLFNQGLLDEVRIYRQTLPDKAIADLYHQGWTPAALSSSTSSATWSYQIPVGLEGPYKIRLRTTDSNGNVSIGS